MIVPEHIAKSYLTRYGIPVPRGRAAQTPQEAYAVAGQIGAPVAVKAQIDSGKRGKAGGIVFAESPDQARDAAAGLFARPLLGFRVDTVLVEEKIPIQQELYAGFYVDRGRGCVQLIVGLAGGIDVEQAQAGSVKTFSIPPGQVLPVHRIARMLKSSGVAEPLLSPLAHVIGALYRALVDLDLVQLEINPLALTSDAKLLALDCKMEVDDNALARQPDFAALYRASLGERERAAADLGVSFVPLDGDVGLIASGAGLGMATLDLMRQAGLRPADFLDTGGGITRDLMRDAVRIVMGSGSARGLMVNLYGGINPMIAAAEGIVEGLAGLAARKPVVVKLLGNSQEEAWRILERTDVTVVKAAQTEIAVEALAAALGGTNGHSA
jgi:succinyl-CoA synthetase beta subunit